MVSCRGRAPQLRSPACATVLVNPAARRVREGSDGGRIVRYLAQRGVEARLVVPGSPGDAARSAEESAARGDDLLFVAGGDGSLRDAALGLAGSATAIAAVPLGTVNILARELGIPRGLEAALDAHLGGQSVHMDLGRADGRCFLLMAGVGWDAEVARRVSYSLKRRVGDLAYVLQAAWMLPRLRPADALWSAGGERFQEPLAWMILGNTRLYGGRIRVTGEAAVDDGELDVIALCPDDIVDGARLALKVATGRVRNDARVLERRTNEIRLETPGIPVQLDGDYVAETPMTFSVDAGALLVSVPAGPLPAIFGRAHVDRRHPG
jgi:diacylglycerol kinase (ATP)